ncbi:MAG: elongation factor P hydroxylase [Halioglobus sp.]
MIACKNHRTVTAPSFDAQRLEAVFAQCFGSEFNTVLRGGFEEPFYQPPGPSAAPAVICFRADYFASALHEVAHWCIAGSERRQCSDYGYWYSPEGRTLSQQRDFERAEVTPQAIEWCFSLACGYDFKISPDNFDPITGESLDSFSFENAVLDRAHSLRECGLPVRAKRYFDALVAEFNTRDCSGNPLLLPALEFIGSEPL